MPSSFDHCKTCAFSEIAAGDRRTVAIEHSINMDYIHGRTGVPESIKKLIGPDRLKASTDCARMIMNGECSIYEVIDDYLAEKEE